MKSGSYVLTASLFLSACSISHLSGQTTKGAVQGAAEATQDPKVQQASQDVTEQVSRGILQALESQEAQQQISKLTREVTQAAAQQMIAALSSEKTRAQIALLASEATNAALKQASATLDSDLGPAMRRTVERDVAAGVASALGSDATQPSIARASHTFAQNAVLGWNHGISDAWKGREGTLHELRATSLGSWLYVGLGLLAFTGLIVFSFAMMLVARARQARSEVARLESATLLLATAMRERQETQQTDEILAVVQHALEGRAERTGKHRILDALRIRKAS